MAQPTDTSMLPLRPDRRRRSRLFWGCVVASGALHALLIAGLPPFASEFAPLPVPVLDVVLVRAEPPPPPPPAAAPPRAASPAPRREAPTPVERVAKAQVRQAEAQSRMPEPRPAPPPMKPVPNPPEPTVAAPAVPSPAPEPAPAQKPVRGVAPAPPAETMPAPSERAVAPVSPPRFNVAYLQNPPPRYPLVARRRGEEGTVTLRVHVRRDGVPATVNLEKSSGSSALDAAALDAVRAWRFAPARQGEEAVDAWVLVPIVFRLEGTS